MSKATFMVQSADNREWGETLRVMTPPAKVPPLLVDRKAKQDKYPSITRREKGTWGGKTFTIVPMRVLTNGGNPPNGPLDVKLSNSGSPPNGPLDVKLSRDVKL